MKVLVVGLIYGSRTLETLEETLKRSGYSADVILINQEGIAQAMNMGLDVFREGNYDAIAYLANDILEPDRWLLSKIEALQLYYNAGIVASSLDFARTEIVNEHIISNWLVSKAVVDAIGEFNESMFPYGPIDLDYVERAWVAGFKTYYVKNCLAVHNGSHAEGDEYGWNKQELVNQFWQQHQQDIIDYRNGNKSIKKGFSKGE
jgi:GT2 family glycosyltransferase